MAPVFCLLAVLVLAASAPAAPSIRAIPAVGDHGQSSGDASGLDLAGTQTDANTIVNTAQKVDQKSGPPFDAKPDLPVADTVVTAVDGQLVQSDVSSSKLRAARSADRRALSDYTQVFDGSGTGPDDRDCFVEGTAYLTYTLVSNSTYNIDDCLAVCDDTPECVFVNLYYEFNNPLLDWVFPEKSNLKCALYGDVHSADEKTNCGGQQREPEGWGTTYIQRSTGWAAEFRDPATPDGYELVFGPVDGANSAPGYMGFVFLSSYDVDACATECNQRGPDASGGACKYVNIWRALVDDLPATYTCSMYYVATNETTATNYGQDNLQVTYSRGYRRRTLVPDGDFEEYQCPDGGSFCYTDITEYWIGTTPPGGDLDAAIFHYTDYSHAGTGVGILGSSFGSDTLPGTLEPALPLDTVPGRQYVIQLFHWSQWVTSPTDTFMDIIWNGEIVETIRPGYSPWTFYQFGPVTAQGQDILQFHGGTFPAYSFIDDVYVFAV